MERLDFKNDIKNVYLFYGEESYKKRLYRNNLKKAVVNGNDMNYSYFEGKGIDFDKVYESVVTLPFFAEKRLVVVENSGVFRQKGKNANAAAEDDENPENDERSNSLLERIIDELPSTTVLAFFEEGAAKNKKTVKSIAANGMIVECNKDDEEDVINWIAKGFSSYGKRIRKSTARLLVNRVGLEYDRLRLEISKAVDYAANSDVVNDEDILAVTSEDVESKIFEMLDAMSEKNVSRVLEKYYDLLANREHPLYILSMLRAQFRTFLQTAELRNKGYNTQEVADRLKKRLFVIQKSERFLHKSFKMKDVRSILEEINETDKKIKTGDIEDRIGVELMLIKFSS